MTRHRTWRYGPWSQPRRGHGHRRPRSAAEASIRRCSESGPMESKDLPTRSSPPSPSKPWTGSDDFPLRPSLATGSGQGRVCQKGIARGRSIVAVGYAGGVLLLAENPSTALDKITEVYDRIFAGVGRYSEFEPRERPGSARRISWDTSVERGRDRHGPGHGHSPRPWA